MSDEDRDQYNDARRRFEDLDIEDQASFLIEAGASTLARGVREAGDLLADGLKDALSQARSRASSSHGEPPSGAAEPETSQRTAPRDT